MTTIKCQMAEAARKCSRTGNARAEADKYSWMHNMGRSLGGLGFDIVAGLIFSGV
jgi:hypothetical protein